MPSLEYLFWIPTLIDYYALIEIYKNLRQHGPEWWFAINPEWNENDRRFTSLQRPLSTVYNEQREKILWDVAIFAYTGYTALYTYAFYICVMNIEMRLSFCWAIIGKTLFGTRNGIIYWPLPFYGVYIIVKSFRYLFS